MAEQNEVFISYRRSDGAAIAEAVYTYLNNKGLRVFYDREKMVDGKRFDEQIRRQVKSSPFYIFIATPDAFRFRRDEFDYVAEEMRLASAAYDADPDSRILLPIFAKGVQVPKDESFPDGTAGVIKGNGFSLSGSLPSDAELRRILDVLTQVSRVNLWFAGRRWLENSKKPGGRFAHLCINDAIMPRAGQGSSPDRRELPIRVTGMTSSGDKESSPRRQTEERPLLDAMRDTQGHIYLIGQGGIGKTTALISIMNQAYVGTEYSETAQIPLFVELSRAPDTYGQLYAHDESTFIRRAIFRQLRADLSAKRVSERQVAELDEEFTLDPAVAVTPINDLLTKETGAPEYLLLLDGLNEVSRATLPEADGYAVVTLIIREVEWIMQNCPNVRVVLTSRTDATEISDESITRLHLSGVDDDTIRTYLTDSGLTAERVQAVHDNDNLLETLRVPLFLTMYAGIADADAGDLGDVSTQGDILRTFFNERSRNIAEYTVRSRVTEVFDDVRTAASDSQKCRMTAEAQHFMLDFILPEIAYRMERAEAFYIKPREMRKIILSVLNDRDDTAVCGEFGQDLFERYGSGRKNTASVAADLRRRYDDEASLGNAVIDCCIGTLGILQEGDDGIGFIHQHIRDYFAAVRNVNTLRLAVYCAEEGESDTALDCLTDLRADPLNTEVRRFIGEYLREGLNKPLIDENGAARYNVPDEPCDRNLLKRALDIFRGRFDGEDGYGVYNLVRIIIDVRQDLSGADLHDLDLRHCSLGWVKLGCTGCGADLTGALVNRDNVMPTGHTGDVSSVAFSPDEKKFATASYDKTIKVWDTRTLELLGTLEGHTEWVNSAIYSPDGSTIVSASDDRTVKIWDGRTLKCIGTLEGHTGSVYSVAYSPDGRTIVSASRDNTIKIWDSRTLKCIGTLEGHTSMVNSAAYSPDGSTIVSASNDRTVKIWDSRTLKCIGTLEGHTSKVTSVAYSPDGSTIVSASWDETIRIWDSQTLKCIGTLEGYTAWVNSAAYSPDGRTIVSASGDGTVKIWDSRTLKCIGTLEGHTFAVNCAAYSPDGLTIVSASIDETVKIWDSRTLKCIGTLEGHTDTVNSAAFSPDGRTIVSGSEDKPVKIWDSRTLKCIGTLEGHIRGVYSAAYSPDGRTIVSASWDDTVKIWDSRTLKCIGTLEGHTSGVNSAFYSPDGHTIVSASYDETVKIWDSRTLKCIGTLEGHTGWVNSAACSPDGRIIVSASSDKTIRIWDSRTLKCIGTLEGHTGWVNSAACSPDGRTIVSASNDGTVKIWDSLTLKCIGTLEGHTEWVRSAAYSPDGLTIVSASIDKTVKIWDSRTLKCIGTLEGHTRGVNSAFYSPDGLTIVSASYDGTIRIWDAKTFECLHVIRNIPGLFVIDCDMRRLHPASNLSEDTRELLRQYGAILD